MFEPIRDIFDNLLAARERRANIRYFQALSDRVLRDIGVERSDIETLFDGSAPTRRSPKQAETAYGTNFAACG
jgi:uncharacterized protein YjiS (DUF1127 family)